ncbi:ABC transporter permease [archaeon]|nr:ABC transporter permease [archaeon]
MRTRTSLKLAINYLVHSKLRSWLTIIGIVIGVAAVVGIMSIGGGMQQSVEARFGEFGADLLTITPGGGGTYSGFKGGGHPGSGFSKESATTSEQENLTQKDVQIIKTVKNVEYVQGTVSSRGEVYFLGEKTTISIKGVDTLVWQHMTYAELEGGRYLNPSDSNVVVIGNKIANDVFKQPIVLNRMITVEGKTFKVVGILEAGQDDSTMIMPIETARTTLDDIGQDEFDSISIKASSTEEGIIDQIIEDIDSKLMLSRHITTERDKDYRITSMQATQESINEMLQTITIFLGAIAAVSLIVGAVGIANTMFTSVLEKTKDIGIMKAIGAKNRDIMTIFIFNSALVGFVGGIIGVLVGVGISALIPLLGMKMMGPMGTMNTVVTPELLIFSLILATSIGVLAGIVPTYMASKLQPVDALRYE